MFLFLLLTHKNPNRATEGGALESTRDATIANGERLSNYIEVRDELLTLGNQKDHVQVSLEDQFWGILGCFYKILIHDSFKLNNSYAKLSVISIIMKFYDPVSVY